MAKKLNNLELLQLSSLNTPTSSFVSFGAKSDGLYQKVGSVETKLSIDGHTHTIAQVTGLQSALDGKQPLDADLTSIAGLTGTSGLLRKTAANTWSLDTNTYLTGNQTITLTGNVTGSGTTSIATTIANNAVTFAKVQNIATQRILGRGTTGSGNIEELTLGSNLSLSTDGVLSSTNTTYTGSTSIILSGTSFQRAALTGDVTSSQNSNVTSIAATVVTGKALTGYTIGTNTALTATDTILSAFGKVQAQINARGGTVTSVGLSAPTGLTVSGSPVTGSGTLTLSFTSNYSIPTTTKQDQWDTAYSQRHTHGNKTIIDKLTQGNIDVLSKLSIDTSGNLKIDTNAYATGELSAYGTGDGSGGGGGIIETVYGYSNLGQTFDNSTLTDTFNAYTINQINTRLLAVEAGSATTIDTVGTGNAITSLTKSGTVITAFKGSSFALSTHNHDTIYKPIGYVPSWSEITDKPTTFTPSSHSHSWSQITSKPSTFAPSAHTLDSHSNVTITSIASGEILKWNGTAWINNTLAEAGISASSHSHSWSEITSKPSTFAPSAHTHTIANVTGLQTALDGKQATLIQGSNITISGSTISAVDTTYSVATTSANGLMSSSDKSKLDGIATGANNYVHPTGAGNNHIPSGGATGQFLKWSASGVAVWAADNNTTYGVATTSANGLMSSADKSKLDGIATGANNYSLPTASATVLGGVKVGSRLTISSGVLSADVQSDNNFTSAYKTKLDGIAAGANNYSLPTASSTTLGGVKIGSNISISSGVISVAAPYTHPSSHPATIITEDASHRFVTDTEKSTWNAKSNLALGATSTTAYRGDRGTTAYNHSQATGNPHGTTFAQINSKPATLAGYGITDAILFNDTIQNTNPFGGRKLYINSLDNALAGAAKKYYVTVTKHKKVVNTITYPKPINAGNILLPQWEDSPVIATYDGNTLFDNVYEVGIACASDEYLKVALDFNADGTAYFSGYPYGTYLLSYYAGNTPEKAEVRCYNGYSAHTTGYKTLSFSDYIGTNSGSSYIQQCSDSGNYGRREIEFIIYGHPSHPTTLTEIEWKLNRPSFTSHSPLFTNHGVNKAYFPFYLGDQTTNKIILNPDGNITATTFTGALSGNAATATTATKLGTATVGSTQLPFYLNAGTATAITQANLRIGLFGTTAIGTSSKPVYIAANGVPTASTSFGGVTGIGTANPLMDGTVAVGTSSLAARQDHRHPVDTSRAAAGQTMHIGTTAVAINRASATLNLTGIGTLSMSGALSGATTIAASTSVTAPKVSVGSNWTIELSGTELQFKYGGTTKHRLFQDGSFSAEGEVSAFGYGGSGGTGGGTTVVWGTTSNNTSPLIVEGVSKTLSLQGHTHSQSEVTGLVTLLNNKLDTSRIQVVTSLPSSPIPGVIYFIKE